MKKKKKQPIKSAQNVVKPTGNNVFEDVKDVEASNVTRIPDLWRFRENKEKQMENKEKEMASSVKGMENTPHGPCRINSDVVSIPSVSPSITSGSSGSISSGSMSKQYEVSGSSSPWCSTMKLLSILKQQLQVEDSGDMIKVNESVDETVGVSVNKTVDSTIKSYVCSSVNPSLSDGTDKKDDFGLNSGFVMRENEGVHDNIHKFDEDMHAAVENNAIAQDNPQSLDGIIDQRSTMEGTTLFSAPENILDGTAVHELSNASHEGGDQTVKDVDPITKGINALCGLDGELSQPLDANQTVGRKEPIIEGNNLHHVHMYTTKRMLEKPIGSNNTAGLKSDLINEFGPDINGPGNNSPAMPLAAGQSKPNSPVKTESRPVPAGPCLSALAQDIMDTNDGPVSGISNNGPVTAQQLQFGSLDPVNIKVTPNFDFLCNNNLKFDNNQLEVDPIRGTKFWNQTLFEKLIKGLDVDESETRLFYEPPKKDDKGDFVVNLNGHFMTKSVKAHRLQLYGYFVGDNLPFQVVKENLIKMWHKFGVTSIIKKTGGFYFFKFANDEGLLQVLERNPWLVQNVPLVLQLWEPDTILSKPDPKTIPIWVTIKDLPLCLWNGGNIGQIASCVGRPLMLDKATYDRCEKKTGPLSFARVLVEADAVNGLPDRVRVNFPPRNCSLGKDAFLELAYRWKPPICHLCNVFGHMTSKHAPVVDEVNINKNGQSSMESQSMAKDDFVEVVRRRNKNKGKKHVSWAPVESTGPAPFVQQASTQSGPSRVSPTAAELGRKESGGTVNRLAHQSKRNSGPGTGYFNVANLNVGPELDLGKNGGVDQSGPDAADLEQEQVSGPLLGPKMDASNVNMQPTLNVSNRYASLGMDDELDDSYDVDIGLWDHEIDLAQKFFKSNTRPLDDEYLKWSDELKKYFEELVRKDKLGPQCDEDQEVESEVDESARFMKMDGP